MSLQFTQLQHLNKLVEDLTTCGRQVLNEDKLKVLKKICRSSDSFIIELFEILMKQLRKKHAEIRLSAFQICDEIFMRSHCFRELVLKSFKILVELTILHNHKKTPLKPESAAKKLRTLAIKSIHTWHEKFKDGYKPLKLGYKYLKECKNVDFEGLAVITEQDRQRRAEERRKEEEIKTRKVQKVENDMSENLTDIKNTVVEFNNTFKLLIPDLHNFFIPLQNDQVEDFNFINEPSETDCDEQCFEYGSSVMQEHGLTKETTVQVNLSNIHKIQETLDNEVIVSTLKEKFSNIKKNFLPKVKEWEQSIMKYSSSLSQLMQQIIDVKRSLEMIIKRYNSVTFIPKAKGKEVKKVTSTSMTCESPTCSSDDDDDDDFIDVPFDDPRVIEAIFSEENCIANESGIKEQITKTNIDSSDLETAGSSGIQNCKHKNKSPNENKDLSVERFMNEEWEKPTLFQSTLTGLSSIWSANEVLHDHEEDVVKPSQMLGIATRVVDFERTFEPVRWECRAPLSSGRLCPRKDRECCPLHGRIVPRDNVGVPVKPEDLRDQQKRQEEYERKHPSWQNPVLLAEIKYATGVDLDMKKLKKRQKKYPDLTDIKALENTPRNRLIKKVFNKKGLKSFHDRPGC